MTRPTGTHYSSVLYCRSWFSHFWTVWRMVWRWCGSDPVQRLPSGARGQKITLTCFNFLQGKLHAPRCHKARLFLSYIPNKSIFLTQMKKLYLFIRTIHSRGLTIFSEIVPRFHKAFPSDDVCINTNITLFTKYLLGT